MAIAIDATSGIHDESNLTTTLSHTCAVGATYLVVGISDWAGDDGVSGVTYNGVAMTQLVKQSRTGGGLMIYLYGLASPASGTHNIVATRGSTTAWIDCSGTSLTGSSTGAVDATNSGTSASGAGNTALTVSLTTVADNCAVLGYAIADNANIGASTNTTEIANSTLNSEGVDASIAFRSSTFPKTPAGAQSYTVSYNANSGNAMVLVSIAPPVSGPANLKTYNTNVKANIKSINTNVIANVKTLDTIA